MRMTVGGEKDMAFCECDLMLWRKLTENWGNSSNLRLKRVTKGVLSVYVGVWVKIYGNLTDKYEKIEKIATVILSSVKFGERDFSTFSLENPWKIDHLKQSKYSVVLLPSILKKKTAKKWTISSKIMEIIINRITTTTIQQAVWREGGKNGKSGCMQLLM